MINNYKADIGVNFEEQILQWTKGQESILNVISVPYNSSEYFVATILFYTSINKNILYITDEDEEHIDILHKIKKNSDFKGYTYLRKPQVNSSSLLKVSSTLNSFDIQEKFDLVIYDDIRSIPTIGSKHLSNLLLSLVKDNGKILAYSTEGIFKNEKDILLPVRTNCLPLIEPRTILTRIDINKDIPFVIYDYLNWSINSKRKIIIYVPSSDKVSNIYDYFMRYHLSLCVNVFYYKEGESSSKIITNFKKTKKGIIITDSSCELFSDIDDTDIIVYFADDSKFDYKKLTYLSARAGRSEKDFKGEVIFLANEETFNMIKAKDITRNFNKKAWDLGFLSF
jgi:late competence protein required for DNA uptake (superfamily II DNA/RNA helicase)